MLDDPRYDRSLAYALLARGRLPPVLLEPFRALSEPRQALGRWLVERELLTEAEVRSVLGGFASEAWEPGGRVGDYVLRDRLGVGGMGEVWHAVGRNGGGERAIKTLLRSATPSQSERFEREIAALTRLDGHPNVVRVHSAGSAGGRPYVVLDYAPGGDLSSRLHGHPLPSEEARRILVELATGLAHVHRHGLLHRDLKPQNVLFAEDGRALLTDFGLVRGADYEALTLSGQLVGTLSYMAPEQAEGGAVDARTDVYGLGAILYHLLSGVAPSSALFAKLRPPSDTNPSAPTDLVRVCMKATARDPSRRYPSAEALAQALLEPAAPRSVGLPVAAAFVVATLGVVGVTVALHHTRNVAPPAEALAPVDSRVLVEAASPPRLSREQQALDAFLASLPEPDPSFGEGIPVSTDEILNVPRSRTIGDAARKRRDFPQAAAYYAATIKEGHVDTWVRLYRLLGDRVIALPDVPALQRACLQRGVESGSLDALLVMADLLWLPENPVEVPLDLALARSYYERALDAAEVLDRSEPFQARKTRCKAYMCLALMTARNPDESEVVGSALMALDYVSRLVALVDDKTDRTRIHKATRALMPRARRELRELLMRVEVNDPGAPFAPGERMHVEVYTANQQSTRWGLLYLRDQKWAEAASLFAQAAPFDGRAWYELYKLIGHAGVPLQLRLPGEHHGALRLACLLAAARLDSPQGLNVVSRVYALGRPGWPVTVNPQRAAKFALRGLEHAEDSDQITELHLRLAELALDFPGVPEVPTREEGLEHLVAAEQEDRVSYTQQVRELRARYRE